MQAAEKHHEMGQAPTGRLLVRYSLPSIAAMILTTAYNMIDRMVVGQATGTIGLAALTVAIPFLMFAGAGAGLANTGGLSLIGRRLGAGDRDGAERALAQAVVSGIVLNSVAALLLWPLTSLILNWFGATDATREPARAFALVMLLSFPFQGAVAAYSSGLRSQGRVAANLLISALSLAVNTALCLLFVFGLHLGTAGSAWAVLGANVVGTAVLWVYFHRNKSLLRPGIRQFRPHWADQAEIARTGAGAWLGNTLPALLILIVNNVMAAQAGDSGLALIGIVHVVGLMAIMPVMGIMQAAGPLISYNHGNGQTDRVRRVFRQSLAAATVSLCLFWIPIELFPGATVSLFASGDTSLVDLGQRTFGVFFLAYPLIGLTFLMSQYYQSLGKGGPSAVNALSRQVIFMIPAMLLMTWIGGFTGFVWSTPMADGLGILLSAVFLWRERRTLVSRPR